MKKILAFILICLTLLPLVACANTGDGESTTPEITDEPIPEGTVVIANEGNTDYKLITGANASSKFKLVFGSFAKRLEELTGAYFKTSDDFLRSDIDPATQAEIVFASANREESKNLYKSINYDGYAIKNEGNKILIAAYTPEAIEQAVESFFNECTELKTTASGKTRLYYVKDKLVKGDRAVFFNDDLSIKDYTIVYSEEAQEAAQSLAAKIKKVSGIAVPTALDKNTERGENEILVGETNRIESQSFKVSSHISIGIKIDGKKIVIRTGTPTNINLDINVIIDEHFGGLVSPNLPADLNSLHLAYNGNDRVDFTDGADIRIMTYNILSEEWTPDDPIAPRVSGIVGCILEYKPDVVGIQEISKNWYVYLKDYLSDEYVFINSKILGKENNNYTGLAYRKETVKLLDTDLMFYSVYNNQRLRLLNTGVFEHIATGQKFIVTSTHYNANHKGAEIENQNRIVQATEFLARVKELVNKYNCPIFSTGDYNCNEKSEPYKIMTEDGFLLHSKDTAKAKGHVKSSYIDHILYHGDVTSLYFTTLVDAYAEGASDHKPIFADFKFN